MISTSGVDVELNSIPTRLCLDFAASPRGTGRIAGRDTTETSVFDIGLANLGKGSRL